MGATIEEIISIAKAAGLDPASIFAVAQVESGGRSGFQLSGLLTVLFEAHIFYRELKKEGKDADALMKIWPGLISKNWDKSLYKGGALENTRLANAIKISPCAWDCASYGMFQIMGFNHGVCGFLSAKEMVAYLKRGQKEHVEVFVRFIKSQRPLFLALQNKNWETFARLYNGESYKKNNYAEKLKAAFDRFSKS